MASSSSSPHLPHSPSKVKRSKLTSNTVRDETKKIKRRQNLKTELPSKDQLIQMIGVLAVAAIVATSATYIINWSNDYFKPFCDSGDADMQDTSDSCIACPKHGRCSGGSLECFPGFTRQGRKCNENRELDKKAQILADRIKDRVCGLYAQSLCDGGIFRFSRDNIKQELNQLDLIEQFKAEEIPFLQEKAMKIIDGSFEINTMLDGSEELKCPDWLAEKYKPLGCRTREWIYKHYLLLFVVFPTVLVLTKLFWRLYKRKRMIARAEQLYQQVCEALEEKALMEKSKGDAGEAWVVSSRLRDHLLLPRERKNTSLWKQVEEFIQEDSRIDQYPKLVKGESKIVLEWQVEGALCSKPQCKTVHHGSSPIKDDSSMVDENISTGKWQRAESANKSASRHFEDTRCLACFGGNDVLS